MGAANVFADRSCSPIGLRGSVVANGRRYVLVRRTPFSDAQQFRICARENLPPNNEIRSAVLALLRDELAAPKNTAFSCHRGLFCRSCNVYMSDSRTMIWARTSLHVTLISQLFWGSQQSIYVSLRGICVSSLCFGGTISRCDVLCVMKKWKIIEIDA